MAHPPGSDPKFSILLPTHNRADVLPFAIRSVLTQTEPDFELLIVGDGCTADTTEAINGFTDHRIRFLNLPKAPNFGYANRNVALRQARGELIAFMAHDDLWFPDHLELLTSCFREPAIEIAYSRPLWVIPMGLLAPAAFNLLHPPTLRSFLDRKDSALASGCVVHRRSCFARDGYWNEALPKCGDWDMWIRIIEGGGPRNLAYLRAPTCLHFRANWRTDASERSWLRVWRYLHQNDDSVPAALRVPVAPDMTEQEAVWRHIEADPAGWSRQVRDAVDYALDQRAADSDALTLALLDQHPNGGSDIKSLSEKIVKARIESERLHSSMAWRTVEWLRAMKAMVVPSGSMRDRLWTRLTGRDPDDHLPHSGPN